MLFAMALVLIVLVSNVVIGYIVAPVLFAQLDSVVAGNIMGIFFEGLYSASLLLLTTAMLLMLIKKNCDIRKEWLLWGTLVAIATNHFWISPYMQAIKEAGMDSLQMGMSFAQWHGLSQVVFMLSIVFMLVWLVLRWQNRSKQV